MARVYDVSLHILAYQNWVALTMTATPATNKSIHPNRRTAKARLRRNAKHFGNRAARAAFNSEWQGGYKWATPAEYHSKLYAFSRGAV